MLHSHAVGCFSELLYKKWQIIRIGRYSFMLLSAVQTSAKVNDMLKCNYQVCGLNVSESEVSNIFPKQRLVYLKLRSKAHRIFQLVLPYHISIASMCFKYVCGKFIALKITGRAQ